jgi:excisionase family DNA binding protein
MRPDKLSFKDDFESLKLISVESRANEQGSLFRNSPDSLSQNMHHDKKDEEALLKERPPALLRVRQAAIAASISETTIRRAITKGELRAARMGKRLLIIRRENLFAWVDSFAAGESASDA